MPGSLKAGLGPERIYTGQEGQCRVGQDTLLTALKHSGSTAEIREVSILILSHWR